ncbi:MAG: ribonuclease HI, partial [Firmicutes bacterium]|nr:ribonuclease HI [Bacillota bacterium]
MKTVNIYTDGACAGNQEKDNIGGWGCMLEYAGREKELNGGEINTTNNRMELTALIEALSALKERGLRLRIFSDS